MSNMLKLFFSVVSCLLVWSSARVMDSRETTPYIMNMCYEFEAQVFPGTILEIKSPNFDRGFYSTNTRCYTPLKSDSQDLLLTLNIKTFDLEPNAQMCDFDYLCINGVRYCGNWAGGYVFQYILPAYSEFTLSFKSDSSVNARGFDIVVSAAQYNNETVNINNGGLGKDSISLQSQQLTLGNLSYQDICGVEARQAGMSFPVDSSTTNYQYTTNNPWYYDTTTYYQYTTNNPWYYDSTTYYQYSTGYPYYYESTTYNPYSTNYPWYEPSTYYPYTTGNPYYNPYTPVASAFPSKDYVASLVQQVIQQLNSERYSQEQASLLLTQLLRYLGY